MTLSFDSRRGGGLTVTDHVQQRTFTLRTDEPVSPTKTATDQFYFPVDDAVAVTAGQITLSNAVAAYVRSNDGEMVLEACPGTATELAADEYTLELCAPMKLYLDFSGAVTVNVDNDELRFEFRDRTELRVGGRSHHEQPATAITTTEDPADMMAAVSALGSALKTTTCERSYPTLRGHPPTIELGERLHIPDCLEVPDTGVTLEVPATYRHVYVVAPLAYYLGAEVVVGSVPTLRTADGFEHVLDGTRGFENEVERVLKQVFLFDCLTRTEGYYPVNLHERNAVEPLVDLDFAALYGASLSEQLEAYLSVPFDVVADYVPEWKLTTHVTAEPQNVESLPFVLDDLAVVRTPTVSEQSTHSEEVVSTVDEFMRAGDFTRSTAQETASSPTLVEPTTTESTEQAWVGDDAPVGASKVSVEAFRNKLDRTAASSDIDITVVCNDPEMDEERDIADEVYGSREDLPFSVQFHRDVTTGQLRRLLGSETNFFHYIGHIDGNGFACADGTLDAATLDSVGVEAFLLNACQSYQQGMHLIETGSIGGVVTLNDVVNSGAVRIGKTMARLLNRGFPLRAALNVARNRSLVGAKYIVVGDGNVDIAQTESGVALLCEIETGETEFDLTVRSYVSGDRGLGGVATTNLAEADKYYLASGELDSFTPTREELREFFALEEIPLLVDGQFVWSTSFDVDVL